MKTSGVLTRKRLHSLDDMAYLQSVDYAYNSRGWLSRINHSNLTNAHYYIQLDQYLTSYEAVDGVRYDSLEIVINEIDRDLLELEYNDNKDMKIISIDSAYIYRYQNVGESSLWQIRRGTTDSLAFESLRTVDGRSLTFSFQNVFFDSSDESQWITDSLSTMVRSQLYLAGINDSTVLDAVERQVVSRILSSISFIYFNIDTNDLFGEDIYYVADETITEIPSVPFYNGNISAIKWQTRQNAGERSYCFTYDNLNRFLQAAYLEKENGLWTRNPGRYNVSGISYDYNGNIQTLDRNGLTGTQGGVSTYGQMDGLTYSYSGNKLNAVEDDIANSGANHNDFKDNNVHETVEYEYDSNGNLVSDDNKGIESITYNHLNLPEEIGFSQTQKITYLYAAEGRKLSETITDGQGK